MGPPGSCNYGNFYYSVLKKTHNIQGLASFISLTTSVQVISGEFNRANLGSPDPPRAVTMHRPPSVEARLIVASPTTTLEGGRLSAIDEAIAASLESGLTPEVCGNAHDEIMSYPKLV